MTNDENPKRFDFEDRTEEFAQRERAIVRRLPRTICNLEDVKQLVRASGSVGANYIEANEALGKKDFRMRVKISRREAKESRFFLRLVDAGGDASLESQRQRLVEEATEFVKIVSAILKKTE